MARTGQAANRWLKEKGHNVITFDEKPGIAEVSCIEHINWNCVQVVVQSPGVPFSLPKPHPITQKAKELGIPVVTDVAILNQYNKKAKYIGITGTNGKSTTTALVGHVLKNAGVSVEVGGNIGKAALELGELGEDGVYVLELSSYQLEMCDNLGLDVVGWVNIAPDHLDRHETMEKYVEAKAKIFRQAKSGVIAIDDEYSKSIYNDLSKKIPLISTSGLGNLEADVTVRDDNLYEHQKFVTVLKDFKSLVGVHNFQNAAVAYGVCRKMGLDSSSIINAFKTFPGLNHRLEFVKTVRYVDFINDSKATNGDATLTALKAMSDRKNVHLILGGKAKADGIKPFKNFLSNVKKFYLIGDAAEQFSNDLKDYNYEICKTLQIAVEKSFVDADKLNERAIVLLSPACASFDQFKDFEERGNLFKTYVQSL